MMSPETEPPSSLNISFTKGSAYAACMWFSDATASSILDSGLNFPVALMSLCPSCMLLIFRSYLSNSSFQKPLRSSSPRGSPAMNVESHSIFPLRLLLAIGDTRRTFPVAAPLMPRPSPINALRTEMSNLSRSRARVSWRSVDVLPDTRRSWSPLVISNPSTLMSLPLNIILDSRMFHSREFT